MSSTLTVPSAGSLHTLPSARTSTCSFRPTKTWRRSAENSISRRSKRSSVRFTPGVLFFTDRITGKISSQWRAFIKVTPRQNEKPVVEFDQKAIDALALRKSDLVDLVDSVFVAPDAEEEW
eukprot:6183939-Pyramimonas_sp.AAC.1